MLSEDEQKLIERLRKEAADVKDCFAQYSLHAITFVTPILGAIITLQANWSPLAGVASIPVILLTLTICRIGTHKYATANRLNGFELHLHRLDSVPKKKRSRWDDKARTMSWEEGMRAWRVVQATMYRKLYCYRPWLPQKPRRKWIKQKGHKWYEPSKLVGDAVYYSGGYLRTLLKVLYAVIAFAYLCLIVAAVAAWNSNPSLNRWIVWGVVIIIMFGCWILMVMRQIRARIASLEGGILSIHSCAIMWHAVSVAHVKALQNVSNRHGRLGLKGYHEELGRLACELADNPLELHEWIYRKDKAVPPGQPLQPTAGKSPSPPRG